MQGLKPVKMNRIDRTQWLAEKRILALEQLARKSENLGSRPEMQDLSAPQLRFTSACLEMSPPPTRILVETPLSGHYPPILLEPGLELHSFAQTRQQAARAAALYPQVAVEQKLLSELSSSEAFSALVCLEPIGYLVPEDWPLTLTNIWNALMPEGCVYFSIPVVAASELYQALELAVSDGLPAVYGEKISPEGYEFTPQPEQVYAWLSRADLHLHKEEREAGVHHFLAVKRRLPTNLLDYDIDLRSGSLSV